jgi:hypothetical protein
MIKSFMMGFNLISLSASGSIVDYVWNFFANICATNLSFLFTHEFAILDENPGSLDVV